MAFDKAKNYLIEKGLGDRVMVFDKSSATVALAAQAVGCEEALIAKSMTFKVGDAEEDAIMILCAGDMKIDNSKYKANFHKKATMLTYDEVHELIGHDVGGVCPFGINDNIKVYLDISLRRFEYVYPACGDDQSAVKLTPDELFASIRCCEWIDVCKSSV